MIESVNNEKIIKYSKLNNKKYRDLYGLYIVEGEHLVEEAKKNNVIEEIFSLDGSVGKKVSDKVMMKLSSLNTLPNILAIVKKNTSKDIFGNLLILDNIQDPGNLGTIIRSAVAFGINTIVASLNTVDVYNSKVLRASEGMFFSINYVVDDIKDVINKLDGYQIFGTDVLNGISLNDVTINGKYAIIMGNEGNGLSDDIKSLIKDNIYIPMNLKCESLNVAIATSIILYEFSKK